MLNFQIQLIMNADSCQKNLSTAAEIAVIVSDTYSEIHHQAVRLALCNDSSKSDYTCIDISNSFYLFLYYVLLFSHENQS